MQYKDTGWYNRRELPGGEKGKSLTSESLFMDPSKKKTNILHTHLQLVPIKTTAQAIVPIKTTAQAIYIKI